MASVGLLMISENYSHDVGDFICFRPLDYKWGVGEMNSNIFRLIKVDMDPKDATEYFCQCQLGNEILKEKKMRAVHLDLNKLPELKNGEITEIAQDILFAARTIKEEIENPFIVGIDPFEVGVKQQ